MFDANKAFEKTLEVNKEKYHKALEIIEEVASQGKFMVYARIKKYGNLNPKDWIEDENYKPLVDAASFLENLGYKVTLNQDWGSNGEFRGSIYVSWKREEK